MLIQYIRIPSLVCLWVKSETAKKLMGCIQLNWERIRGFYYPHLSPLCLPVFLRLILFTRHCLSWIVRLPPPSPHPSHRPSLHRRTGRKWHPVPRPAIPSGCNLHFLSLTISPLNTMVSLSGTSSFPPITDQNTLVSPCKTSIVGDKI
jgi:hypothetical protein